MMEVEMADYSKPKAATEPVATKSLSDYLASELFNMVYMWGRVGIVVDSTAPAFQDKLKELMEAHDERS